LWRVADGALLKTYDQETGAGVRSVQYSLDGRFFAYGCADVTIALAHNPFFKFQLGDTNCDGSLTVDDIHPFVTALSSSPTYYEQYPDCNWHNADCNEDGAVNFADINPFVELLSQ
jgi:hypothetical protein